MRAVAFYGLSFATLAAAPAIAGAQARPATVTPPARVGVVIATPPAPRHDERPLMLRRDLREGWGGIPWAVDRSTVTTVPVTVPVPYPVYYPARARAEAPKAPPVPYDPTKASMRIVGRGRDGGAGVLSVEPIGADSVRIVWLGSPRPIREARLYLADDTYQPLRTKVIDADHREARLPLRGTPRPASFAGLDLVYADGARMTWLVPTRE